MGPTEEEGGVGDQDEPAICEGASGEQIEDKEPAVKGSSDKEIAIPAAEEGESRSSKLARNDDDAEAEQEKVRSLDKEREIPDAEADGEPRSKLARKDDDQEAEEKPITAKPSDWPKEVVMVETLPTLPRKPAARQFRVAKRCATASLCWV